jgi:hypothetical protein
VFSAHWCTTSWQLTSNKEPLLSLSLIAGLIGFVKVIACKVISYLAYHMCNEKELSNGSSKPNFKLNVVQKYTRITLYKMHADV